MFVTTLIYLITIILFTYIQLLKVIAIINNITICLRKEKEKTFQYKINIKQVPGLHVEVSSTHPPYGLHNLFLPQYFNGPSCTEHDSSA